MIANYLDNSQMRNKIALDLASEMGIGLGARFVDIWMNGEYLGNYILTPKYDYLAPKEGYALESDQFLEPEGGDPQFHLPDTWEIGKITGDEGYYNRITVKDIGSKAEKAGVNLSTIEEHFLKAWAAVRDYGSEDYQNYFDIDSWARMFLMYEVSKTYDCYAGSLHMHRDGLTDSDKLIAGPAWDYDASFGRTLHKFLVGVSEPIQLNAEGWYNDSIGLLAADAPVRADCIDDECLTVTEMTVDVYAVVCRDGKTVCHDTCPLQEISSACAMPWKQKGWANRSPAVCPALIVSSAVLPYQIPHPSSLR